MANNELQVGDWLYSAPKTSESIHFVEVTDDKIIAPAGKGFMILSKPLRGGEYYQLGGIWHKCSPQKVAELLAEREAEKQRQIEKIKSILNHLIEDLPAKSWRKIGKIYEDIYQKYSPEK